MIACSLNERQEVLCCIVCRERFADEFWKEKLFLSELADDPGFLAVLAAR